MINRTSVPARSAEPGIVTAPLTPPAGQQPDWGDHSLVHRVRARIATMPGLVSVDEIERLRELLTEVAEGRRQVIQAGDCAERPADCVPPVLAGKAALLGELAATMRAATGVPVTTVGRIAGQFAKPRSHPTELVGGLELPVFRGLLVNSPEPTMPARRPDPLRLLAGYRAARSAMDQLRRSGVWTSHEALLLDYELPLLRWHAGRQVLTSTHWPWIGERTRDPRGAHVRMLADVVNPVACKVGPGVTPDDLLGLCDRLDPRRVPGRLTFIARLGAGSTDRLGPLVRAVRSAGHPVIWICDPMHGNTIRTPDGRKTRLVDTMAWEIAGFLNAVVSAGGVAGGLHLEATPDAVTECVTDESEMSLVGTGGGYRSLCDPRLNPGQALAVAAAWRP